MQQMFLGAGGSGADPLYIDDVFSTYLWKGTGGNITHNNGLDLSTEGGMVWIKSYSDAYASAITDTVRGTTKQLQTSTNAGDLTNSSRLTAFNTNGFTTSSEELVGSNTKEYASWSWRKAKKWFDIQTWSGNLTSGRQISHDLGCVPGLILVKRNNGAANWSVYHAGLGPKFATFLNTTGAASESSAYWNNTAPTDSVITLGNSTNVNGGSGDDYIAYIFGGGESTAATARSVDLDGSDYLYSSSSSDFTMGTGDFTVECWARLESLSEQGIFQISSGSEGWSNTIAGSIGVSAAAHGDPPYWEIAYGGGDAFGGTDSGNYPSIQAGNWYHIAYVRASGVTKLYVNGQLRITKTDTHNYTGNRVAIGRYRTNMINGSISNFRVVKGTAVYTADFVPPTEPLTNITNTKLLCCNNSSTTGSTVEPGTITASGDPTASVNSPFDDPENFAFGPDGDQNAIKVGRYNGNGSTTNGPEIYLGFEPSLIILKDYHDTGQDWVMFDSIRGIYNDSSVEDQILAINAAESQTGGQFLTVSATGFRITSSHNRVNSGTRKYVYVAFRRSDGGVGTPGAAGTDVFAMDVGASSTANTIPDLDSGFPVDIALIKHVTADQDWHIGTRLMGRRKLNPNTTAAESLSDNQVWTSNLGCWKNLGSNYQGWMWKRGPGVDFAMYKGNSTAGHQIPHSLSKSAEMIWIKRKSPAEQWVVGHKGLDGGNQPWTHFLTLNTNAAEADADNIFNDTAPVATHFTLGDGNYTNNDGDNYIAMLFASVDGISKVGYYTGSSSDVTINLGFEPRFLIIKARNLSASWLVIDTLRGIATSSGNNSKYLFLESNGAQGDLSVGYKTATGFVAKAGSGVVNDNSSASYIYYAHA
jgi:hypothetical protein